ncbi:MAG: TIGR04283 family arsenosugar biosynthesis glycosyltransferase [Gammaproteobacteria bacterium]|nr:TIGR04283 family arsenosugar biosynthesis glycosyltransferase [Gammaproteobacteria bacterium]
MERERSLQPGSAPRLRTRKEVVGRSPTRDAYCHKNPSVSVVIPALNDAEPLAEILGEIAGADGFEVVVADGGSQDDTEGVCERHGAAFVSCQPHRARQMRRGAELARGGLIWFLHADSRVEPALLDALRQAAGSVTWGRFDVRLSNPSAVFELIAWSMNQRSCLTGICTGDQGIFVSRRLLEAVGGMPDQPLMEDVELSKRLRRLKRPTRVRERLVASSRRWEREGVVRTTVLMWSIRLRYFLGASPEDLHASYYPGRPLE